MGIRVLLLVVYVCIVCPLYAQQEQFIDPKTYEKTNTVAETNDIVPLSVISNESLDDSKVLENAFIITEKPEFEPIDAIVLDAGHGGKDPGGVKNNIREKELVLKIVAKVHKLFRTNNKKIQIFVTRKNDKFVTLEDRVSKTARWSSRKNVLFISIHGNISLKPNIEGLEIYTLSDKASDNDALAVERIENAGFTVEDVYQTDSGYSVLADLLRDSTRKQSEWLAKYTYDSILKSTQAYGRGLKRANFFVLKYNTVPSILVEIGYMSHPFESKKLKQEEYQNKLAIGVYEGVSQFIKEYNETEGFTK